MTYSYTTLWDVTDTTIRYNDDFQAVMFDTAAKFSVTPIGNADSDNLLEPEEVYELALLNMETNLTAMLARSTTFTIEVFTRAGGVLHIELTTPIELGYYNDLTWGTTRTPPITVSSTSGLVTTEAGGTASFTVVLRSQPTADVTIALSSSDTTEGTVSPTSLTFTSLNWNTAQTVTATGVDDAVNDGNVAYTIVTAAATSTDGHYDGLNPADVSVTNLDDDTTATLYVVDSGSVNVFKYEDGGTLLGTNPLDGQNANAKGITHDATEFWTTDITDDKSYKYDSSFSLLTSWVLNGFNANGEGIATDGNTIWVVDDGGNEVWYYTMSGSYVNGWLLSAGNTTPRGITTNGINIWVINGGNDTVYKYDIYGLYVSSFAPTAANADAEGITTDGSNIWVADSVDNLIYKYAMSGSFISSFSLAVANSDATGITVSPKTGLASFQEGSNSYASTLDTRLKEGVPSTPAPDDNVIVVDADAGVVEQGLIRFDSIFGGGATQIPLGSTITSAALTVYVGDSASVGDQITLHRMLVDWNGAATWDSLTGGIQADDIEAASAADATLPSPETTGSKTFSGLEATLQAWSNGAANYGWGILSNSGNGWVISSSENATQSQRPILRVTYKK